MQKQKRLNIHDLWRFNSQGSSKDLLWLGIPGESQDTELKFLNSQLGFQDLKERLVGEHKFLLPFICHVLAYCQHSID